VPERRIYNQIKRFIMTILLTAGSCSAANLPRLSTCKREFEHGFKLSNAL